MSQTRCETGNWLLYPLTAIVVLQFFINLSPKAESIFLNAYCIFVLFAHIHFGVGVVRNQIQN